MLFSASAPGKAVLSGEYAVLQGAPAISMAVDCRARVSVESTESDVHSVTSPGVAEEARFRCTERGVIEWLDEDRVNLDQSLLEHVWRVLQALPREGLALTLDTRRFFDPESSLKLGFGSSAALAVALTAALARAGSTERNLRNARDLMLAATAGHFAFQGGKGSGVDVATAVNGGVIAFSMRPDRRIQPLKWPPGLRFSLMWSGRPASTAERLTRLERFENKRAARSAAARLADASRSVLDAWQRAKSTTILDALRSYTAALRRFSIEHGLGVFEAGHQELSEIADDFGFVYKPCGAGGGDIGVVFMLQDATDAHVAGFGLQAGQMGFRRLDHSMESAGLIYEH